MKSGKNPRQIVRTVEVLAYLDLVFAKARYAEQLNATRAGTAPFPRPPE